MFHYYGLLIHVIDAPLLDEDRDEDEYDVALFQSSSEAEEEVREEDE